MVTRTHRALLVQQVGVLAADAQVLHAVQVHRGHHLLHHGLLHEDVRGLLLLLLHRDQVAHRLVAVERVRRRGHRAGRQHRAGHRLRGGHLHGAVGRRRLLAAVDGHVGGSAAEFGSVPRFWSNPTANKRSES